MAAHLRVAAGIACISLCFAAPVGAHQRTHGPDAEPETMVAAAAQAAPTPPPWCGNSVPGTNQVENGDYRYHAVYAYAADRSNRLATFGPKLQQDAFRASSVIERQYGRAIRFDIGTDCGPGQLDITSVRLPYTATQLSALAAKRGSATFDAVASAMRAAGYGVSPDDETVEQIRLRSVNYLVWLDGAAPPRTCGQGTALLDSSRSDTNVNNYGGKLAVIFRDGSEFCGPDVVRHEIGHNLGALQPEAPNTTDGVHCDDAFEDTMCAWEAPKIFGGAYNSRWFDYHNDDYWDPPNGTPLDWWTLNLSRFICPDAACNRPPGTAVAAEAPRPKVATLEHPAQKRAKQSKKRRAKKDAGRRTKRRAGRGAKGRAGRFLARQ